MTMTRFRTDFRGRCMRLARWSLLLFAMVSISLLGRGGKAERPATSLSIATVGRVAPVSSAPAPTFLGAGSCSAIACHGNIAPTDRSLSRVLRNEHTTWLSNDSHARAYEVLFSARSQRIARNLAPDPTHITAAHQEIRCLACHTAPRSSSELQLRSGIHSDGVGCESCHGPSSQWLGPHTTPEWGELSVSEKSARGMQNIKDLLPRGRLCAGCHVGDGGSLEIATRDVNHDLIAAGHPRLHFELAAFLDNMPAHWIEKGINQTPTALGDTVPQRAADFPARAWAIGRLVAAEFALKLLESRASKVVAETSADTAPAPIPVATTTTPWPEFSEFNCFSCHHDLRDQPWRRPSPGGATNPGSARWGSWTISGVAHLLEEVSPLLSPGSAAATLRELTTFMEQNSAVASIPIKARLAADTLAKQLDQLEGIRFDTRLVERLINQLEKPESWQAVTSWDEATQRYLALVALRQSWTRLDPARKPDQDRLATRLEVLRDALSFPPGFDSPASFDPKPLRPRESH